jgi:hypothetical protein
MEYLLAFLLIALLLVFARYLFVNRGIYLPDTVFRILLVIHCCFLAMTISTFVLSNYNLYWRGYRSTSIIIILTAFTGLLCIWLSKRKPYLIFVFFVLIEIMLSVILVFFTADSYTKDLYYNDAKYRLENTQQIMMAHPSLPDLFVKKGLFEKKYILNSKLEPFILDISQIKKATINELTEHSISITFSHSAKEDSASGLKNPLIVHVDLNQ